MATTSVFINYRREDTKGEAVALRTLLAAKLPRCELFMDVDGGIRPGENYIRVLDERVAAADVFLCLIGSKWLDVRDEKSRRRLDSSDDFVRIEIGAALKRDIPILPILIDDVRMPAEAEMPDAIRLLSYKQAMRLRHDRFNADAEGIAGAIKGGLSRPKTSGVPRWMLMASISAALGLGAVAGFNGLRFIGSETTDHPSADTELSALKSQLSELRIGKQQAEALHQKALKELQTAQDETAKDSGLRRLNRQIAELTNLLSLEKAKSKSTDDERAEHKKLSDDATAKVEILNQQLLVLRRQIAALNEALDASEKKDKDAQDRIKDLGARLNVALARQVQELQRYRSDFFGRLRELLRDRKDIRVVGDRFVFQSEVLFPSGQAQMTPEGLAAMDRLAAAIAELERQIPKEIDWALQVDGHTDVRPIASRDFPSNWELSTAHAISVVRYLIARGVPARRLVAAGYGGFQPLEQGKTEEDLRRNRRIELKLINR